MNPNLTLHCTSFRYGKYLKESKILPGSGVNLRIFNHPLSRMALEDDNE
jgi:hypothetical protein